MKLTNERDIDVASLALSSEQLQVRSPGLHVSSIIRHINTTIGKHSKSTFTESDLDQFAVVGRLWEAQLAAAMFQPPRYQRVGEIELDGIVGSPDAYDIEGTRVLEFKVTWRSAKHDIQEFRSYFWQIMAYCHMLETHLATLVVFYVCGDYQPPVPIAKAWDVAFTTDELRQNWRMLLENGKELQ